MCHFDDGMSLIPCSFFFTTPTSRSVWTGAWSWRLWHDFEHVLCWLKLPLFHTIQRVLAKQKWSALYEATIFSIQIFIMLDTGFWEEFWTPRFLEFVRRPQFLGWEVIRESTHIFSIVQTCGPSFHRLDNLPLSLRQNSVFWQNDGPWNWTILNIWGGSLNTSQP